LSPATAGELNTYARQIQATTHGDIAVAVLPTIGDYRPYEVGATIFRTWKVGGSGEIGTAQRNLGAVVLVVPKTNGHRGTCYISPGMGAEGFLTDSKAGEICREAVPLFAKGAYDEAVSQVVHRVGALLVANTTTKAAPAVGVVPGTTDTGTLFGLALFVVLGLGAVILAIPLPTASREPPPTAKRTRHNNTTAPHYYSSSPDDSSSSSYGSGSSSSDSSSNSDSFGGGGGSDGGGGGSDF